MTSSDDRRAILDSARYLRGVRPLDPDELCEYVEGGVHPAVVRQVLREHAVELDVIERSDGTFVPVPGGSVPARGEVVTGLPEEYGRRVEDLLVERFGTDWHRGESGDRLRERIRRVKEDYYQDRAVEYDEVTALGYAIYHLADFYAAGRYVFDDLARHRLLDRGLRVLDVGAGVGGPALGLHDHVFGSPGEGGGEDEADGREGSEDEGTDDGALVEYHAVEPSAAADVLEALLEASDRNFHPAIHRTTAEAFDPDGEYDLVVFASVVNELDDPVETVGRYLEALAPDGTLAMVAPADRETSVGLRAVERELEERGATVFGPEVRLWQGRTPSDTGWSFDERPAIDPPAIQRKLDDSAGGSGEFRKTEVRFTPSVLRRDDRRRVEFDADPGRWRPMADADEYVTGRVDLVGVKLSRSLSEDGANPLYRVGDGSQREDHFAVLVEESALNRGLPDAEFGDLLLFEAALALWNDDEAAYNLVVDEETVVDRIPV